MCEGVAGLAWRDGWVAITDLPSFAPGSLRNMADLSTYPKESPERQYAEATNIRSAADLRTMEHYAEHFMGSVIERHDSSGKWGVLLLDSLEHQCPFPNSHTQTGKQFRKDFEYNAAILGRMLT